MLFFFSHNFHNCLKVIKTEKFGCFVELWLSCEELVHISQLVKERVNKVDDVVKVGDTILVKSIGLDKRGKQNFSRKDAINELNGKQK